MSPAGVHEAGRRVIVAMTTLPRARAYRGSNPGCLCDSAALSSWLRGDDVTVMLTPGLTPMVLAVVSIHTRIVGSMPAMAIMVLAPVPVWMAKIVMFAAVPVRMAIVVFATIPIGMTIVATGGETVISMTVSMSMSVPIMVLVAIMVFIPIVVPNETEMAMEMDFQIAGLGRGGDGHARRDQRCQRKPSN